MKHIFKWSFCCLLFSLLSCNKDDQYQTSTWSVNNDTFSANDYSIGIGKAEAGFQSTNIGNRFSINFYISYLPTTGNWLIKTNVGQNPNYAHIGIYYYKEFYIVSPFEEAYLVASEKNKKASYYLSPTWFINYNNPEDSVLIQGTFNEP